MTSRRRTTSNQRWNNVVYVNVEIYNVEQRWNNAVFFNVELNNVETTLSFSTSIFTTLGNVETTLRIWPFEKKKASIQKQNNIFELQGICWTQNLLQFFPILRGICKRIFAEPQKFLKHRIYWIIKSIFKQSQEIT